jgi:hypothetical protein
VGPDLRQANARRHLGALACSTLQQSMILDAHERTRLTSFDVWRVERAVPY